ncbi:hypothetical protein [Nocardioides aurantiacus]|uniref:Uncharacterized protein n=1 Tax=Nocardioides aurantiacus TaxID=86796 RepID=A0A3N2CQ71_9ACTN|nr:hypothetical protein [Nocardioides aurantiacus]ROR89566.1 hypothetical protein EDD33_0392 [Nocardioides aurantiacus]
MAPTPASATHEAVLDVHDRPGWRRAADVVGVLVGSALGDSAGLGGDVVVRSRADGSVLWRTDVGPGEEAASMLGRIREDLDRMSVEEFLETRGGAATDDGVDPA